MHAEEFRELLSKIEIDKPLDPKDFIKAILGEQQSEINLGDEIKKIVISKVVELVGPIKALKSGIIEEPKINEKRHRDSRGRFVKSPEKLKEEQNKNDLNRVGDILFNLPSTPPPIPPKNDSAPSTEPKTYESKVLEVNLSENTLKKLKHILSVSKPLTKKSISEIPTQKEEKKSLGIMEWAEEIGKAFFKTGLAVLAVSTFGPAITGIIDKIFGTNLTNLFAPFHESVKKWQGWIDDFGKWSALLGLKIGSLAAKAGVGIIKTTGRALGIIPKATKSEVSASTKVGFIGKIARQIPLVRNAYSTLTGRRMITPARANRLLEIKKAQSAATAAGGKFTTLAKFGGKDAVTVGKGILPKVATKLGSSILGTIGKTFLRKLPFIGFIISAGMGIQKLIHGDIVGGLLDIASGLVTFIPYAGIPLSLAIDVLNASVTEKAGGDKNKKAGALKDISSKMLEWIQDKISNVYPFNHVMEIGEGISEGDWLKAIKGFVRLSPPLGFLLDVFENSSKVAESKGEKLSFNNFFKNIKESLLTNIVNNLPENFGIRAAAAKLLGVKISATPSALQTKTSQADINTAEIAAVRKRVAEQKKSQSISVIQSSSNASISKNLPGPLMSNDNDIKEHLSDLKEVMSNMVYRFGEISKNLLLTQQAGSVNINNHSTVNSQHNDAFLSGSRDPIHDWRLDVWKNTILGTR